MALASTEPLNTNEYQEYFLLVDKGGWRLGLTTLLPLYAPCFEIWEPQTPETLRAGPSL
jgi:hypothetical protein